MEEEHHNTVDNAEESKSNATDIKFSKRLSLNLVTNVLVLILNIFVGIFLTPYYLDTLGESAYSIIPLSTSITSYVTLIVNSLNASVSRYLMIDLRAADFKKANNTFNTALFGITGIVGLLVPIALIIACISPYIFEIGDQAIQDVIILFALVFGAALINVIAGNFMLTLHAYNRFDLRNIVTITQQVFQVEIIIMLFTYATPSLPFVGISYFIAAIVALIIAFILSRKTCHELKISRKAFSKSRAFDIGSMTFWTLIANTGNLLKINLGLIFINLFCGEIATAEYSIAYMGQTLCMALVNTITTLFIPMIYTYAAVNDIKGLQKFMSLAVKCSCLLMAMPIGFACIYADQLLSLWVGAEYAHLGPLLVILILPSIVFAGYACIVPISSAYLRVKQVALMGLSFGVINVILDLIFLIGFNLGEYGVAIAIFITAILSELFIIPIYVAYILKLHFMSFIKPMFPGVVMLGLIVAAYAVLRMVLPFSAIVNMVICVIVLSAVVVLISTKLILNAEERGFVRECLPKWVQRFVPKLVL